MLRILIEAQADIHARGAEGWTALFFASCGGHVDAVELLISQGVNIAEKDTAGRSPLDVAIRKGHEDVADLLRRSDATR
jgi:ankyrin repeat protein